MPRKTHLDLFSGIGLGRLRFGGAMGRVSNGDVL